eukprot:5876494-Alexandrium_andersonii.AAC.1
MRPRGCKRGANTLMTTLATNGIASYTPGTTANDQMLQCMVRLPQGPLPTPQDVNELTRLQ